MTLPYQPSLFQTPFKQGEEDFLNRVPFMRCPYFQEQSRKQWREGWKQAFKILFLDDKKDRKHGR